MNTLTKSTETKAVKKSNASSFNLRLKKPNYWNTPSPSHEKKLLEHWRESNLLENLKKERHGNRPFVLLDGPPYANGDAHLGHLLNKTLKDVNARFASMRGYDVHWRAGWDCHGLPLELVVEKKHGPGAKSQVEKFMGNCRAEAVHWQQVQSLSMQRAGLLADFQRPWMTSDPGREAASLSLMLDLWKAGLLVERNSPVHWCPACQSALAASELEKEVESRLEAFFLARLSQDSVDVLRGLSPKLQSVRLESLHLLSWTSTPWTLWANAGFAHPSSGDLTLAALADGRLVLVAVAARDMLVTANPNLFSDNGRRFDGFVSFEKLSDLCLSAYSPLTDSVAPLLPGSFVTQSDGSGFVHLAPAFGPDDYEMHEEHNVRLDCHVGPDGRLLSKLGERDLPSELANKNLGDAAKSTCELLDQKGLLVLTLLRDVEVNVCWRHKKSVFYKASQQWALDLLKSFPGCKEGLAARAMMAVEKTKFLPDDRAKAPLLAMMSTRRYWTLSRDRYWGLPLPFFRHEQTGELHPETERFWKDLVPLVQECGVESWQRFPTPHGYVKTSQTADVWFDSGAAWLTVSESGLKEVDMVVEGRDQTRGWFLSSFLLHAFQSDRPPFKTVMTHSFVVDEKGHKFSKSKGGGPDHRALFEKAGADAFRLWVSAQTVGEDCKWSRTSLDQATQDLKDWRSFLRFHLSNMEGSYSDPAPVALRPLDSLAMEKLASVKAAWTRQMEDGRFNQALVVLAGFRQWASTEWFELSKRTLYCSQVGNQDLVSAQWALTKSFLLCAQMLSPFLPFATEEAYLSWDQKEKASLFLHELQEFSWNRSEASAAACDLLAFRRGALPLVERGRGYVAKGEPVCLVLSNCEGFLTEDQARELFPGCYVRLDGVDCLEASAKCESPEVMFAGRPKPLFAPHRCDRCRGYFSKPLQSNNLCTQCLEEMS